MSFLPGAILGMWLRGLLAVGILAGSVYLLTRWTRELPASEIRMEQIVVDPDGRVETREVERRLTPYERVVAWRPGWDWPTACLAGAVALALLGSAGRVLASPRLFRRRGDDEPQQSRGGETLRLKRPDGTQLQVECYGPSGAPRMVLTHGWGCDSAMWYYAKRHWADRYRLVVWDLPGHGLSSEAKNRDYSTERLAADLRAVVEATGTDPVILVGHSLGGMTVLTFCRLFPQLLGKSVASLVLVHTTPTNPLRTMSLAALYSALQKPLIEPLLHLTIWTWPLVWGLNWLSYWNGSAHRSTSRSSFAGNETRGQLDFAARYTVQTSRAVMGRGGLGMLRYDARQILNQVRVPVRVVGGDGDPVTSPDASRWLASTIPEAKLVMLAPAKHLGFLEHHVAFGEAVTSPMLPPRTGTLAASAT